MATQAFTVLVNAAPAITSANATSLTVGSAGVVHRHDDRLPGADGQRHGGHLAGRTHAVGGAAC